MNNEQNTNNPQSQQLNIAGVSGSALIAEFLGSKFINDAPEDYPNGYYYQPEGIEDDCPTGEPDEWCFNSSWDWLMPVLEKIERLGFITIQHGFLQPYGNGIVMYDMYIKKQSKDFEKDGYIYEYEGEWNTSKIEAAWIAVIEFIKWWNASLADR